MTLVMHTEKNSPFSGICVAPPKPGPGLRKRRYADLRSRSLPATHCVALRSGLRSTFIDHLTCINIDHLEGCYAATQIRGSRLRAKYYTTLAAPWLLKEPEQSARVTPHQPNRRKHQMSASKTATVETLTAEVRVLMVGSRQVTMSVYGQLDEVDYDEIEPFGRVAPKDAQAGNVYVIGKRAEGADLVSSWLPCTESRIRRWAAERSSAAAYERSAEAEDGRAERCEDDATEYERAAGPLIGDGYVDANGRLDIKGCAAAGRHAAQAVRHDHAAEVAEHEALVAEDEITRLSALADAASSRYQAARDRDAADEKRAEAIRLELAAQDCRTRATVHRSNTEAHRVMVNQWTERESQEIEIVTAKAAEWEALPLIVLAGLR